MFTFPIEAVRRLIARGKADAETNGGFRDPYYGLRPGEGDSSGVWLVGDEGVYLMANGRLAPGERPLVVYAEECHLAGNPDWHDYKRRHFGADDGVEFLDAEHLTVLFDRHPGSAHLRVQLTEAKVSLSLITR